MLQQYLISRVKKKKLNFTSKINFHEPGMWPSKTRNFLRLVMFVKVMTHPNNFNNLKYPQTPILNLWLIMTSSKFKIFVITVRNISRSCKIKCISLFFKTKPNSKTYKGCKLQCADLMSAITTYVNRSSLTFYSFFPIRCNHNISWRLG